MINGLEHIGCTIEDMDRSIDFYINVLGIEHYRLQPGIQPYLSRITGLDNCQLRIGFLQTEGDTLSFQLLEYVNHKSKPITTELAQVGAPHLCWRVASLDAVTERLSQQEVQIISSPDSIGHGPLSTARGVFLRDPDGILIELIEIEKSGDKGRLTNLHHVGYTVSDIDAAVAFMSDTLGLRLVERWSCNSAYFCQAGQLKDARIRAAYLIPQDGLGAVELIEFASTSSAPILLKDIAGSMPGSVHGMFIVDDIHQIYSSLSSEGIRFTGPPAAITAGVYEGCYAIYLAGPDGIPIELFEGPGHIIEV